tara:strand:+ start:2625 stop:3233 length:609 start_codon:yes stop_codon:yes gene_type:complete
MIKCLKIQIPDSIRNWSIDLVLQQSPDLLAYHDKPVHIPGSLSGIVKRDGNREHMSLNELKPTSLTALIDFLQSDEAITLVAQYKAHAGYPFNCSTFSWEALDDFAQAGIQAMEKTFEVDRRFQSLDKPSPHVVNLVMVTHNGTTAPWVIDITSDQHVGIEEPVNIKSTLDLARYRLIIRAYHTQSSPLVGPLAYFDKLYIN